MENNAQYFILVLALLAVLARLGFLTLPQFFRWRVRQEDLEQLAQEFQLTFQSQLSLLRFLHATYLGRDTTLFILQGQVRGHNVLIEDKIKGNIFFKRRFTNIQVDQQPARIGFQVGTFGASTLLSSVAEIRKFLNALT